MKIGDRIFVQGQNVPILNILDDGKVIVRINSIDLIVNASDRRRVIS